MKKYVKILILILLVFSHAIHFAYPQEQQFKFDHITTEQGLSHNMTNSIIQDSKGFLWIGTNRGLNRYDGNVFKIYKSNQDSTSLTGVVITDVFEDREGNIWVGTRWSGLNKYNRALDNFRQFKPNPNDSASLNHPHVTSIYQDKEGTIWVATYGGGLNKFDDPSETFSVYQQFPEQPNHSADNIFDLYDDNKGTFWIGAEAGLFIFDREKEIFQPFELDIDIPPFYKATQCIYQDNNNILWFGTYLGLFNYNNITKEITRTYLLDYKQPGLSFKNVVNDVVIQCIAGFKSGDNHLIWVGTRRGLYEINIEKNKITNAFQDSKEPFSLSGNYITDLCFDNSGNLWLATYNSGLNKINLRKSHFQKYFLTTDKSNIQYPATTFYMDKKENLWVSSYGGGLFKFDRKMNKVAHYKQAFYVPYRSDSILTSYVKCLLEDSRGVLWVSFGVLGLTIFDTISESFIPVYGIPDINDNMPHNIMDIIEDQYGRIWFADWGDGLFYKEVNDDISNPLKKINQEHLCKAKISDLFEDSNGNIWIGTFNAGLFRLAPENRNSMNFIHYQNQESDTNGYYGTYINSFCEDLNGNLWITTSEGLNKFDQANNTFIVFKQHSELYGDQILKIYADANSNLWFNHYSYGLVRFDPYDSIQNPIKVFSTQDGLPFNNVSYRGFYQAEDGRIFVGGAEGTSNCFYGFYPDSLQENKQIPFVAITDFKVRNRIHSLDSNITEIKKLTLNHDENFFSFEFAALDYTNPAKNQYAYYLEGLEADWIYSRNRKYANYTGVPPGEYVFHVKGSNNDGFWNEKDTTIAITIFPPPWKTWWAYLIYGVILIGLFFTWRRYYLRRQRFKQKLELEHVEAEKLKEMDTMKSRFFANISHEFRTPLTLILGPLQNMLIRSKDKNTIQDINLIQRNARRLQNLINQLLDISKLESGKMKLQTRAENIVALVNGYVQSFESLAKQKEIDLSIFSTEENIPLFVDKDHIEKILYNLLSNAFKFTESGGKIEVFVSITPFDSTEGKKPSATESYVIGETKIPDVWRDRTWVKITISDTGRGIPSEKLKHIFDRFYQADNSYIKDHEGTGIGLTLTKELVEIHHGIITVESKSGLGTTFNVFLPLGKEHLKQEEIVDKNELLIKNEESSISIPELELSESDLPLPDNQNMNELKPHLLIVDDNDDLRIYMKEYLHKDYYISEAREGAEGFDMATEKMPDLVISDVMMPEMDGYELCRKLRADERTSHIPIILLTAKAGMENKIEGLETGADDFITKPFDANELQTRVKNLIKQRILLREFFQNEIKKGEFNLPDNLSLSGLTGLDQQFIQKIYDVLEQHFSDPEFNVETFSKEMAISRVHLHRKLKALVNHTASELIRTYRLNKAAVKLAGREASISEIAYDVGFSTVQYFSKCFLDQFGMSPSDYLHKP